MSRCHRHKSKNINWIMDADKLTLTASKNFRRHVPSSFLAYAHYDMWEAGHGARLHDALHNVMQAFGKRAQDIYDGKFDADKPWITK